MHNAKGYDNHFIIRPLMKRYGDRVEILGTKERFARIRVGKIHFMDSFSHLSDKLDNLATNLRQKDGNNFPLIQEEFPNPEQFNLVLQKLPYPYSFMTDFEKFKSPIPAIEAFYNNLTAQELPQKEYTRLLKACQVFNIQTLGQLHDLYLRIDCLLLASVFESYRQLGLSQYHLDPSHYVSAPSFSFDAMLFLTDVKLELLQDAQMYGFIEKGRRGNYLYIFYLFKNLTSCCSGGVSSIYKRLANANCQTVPGFDPRIRPATLFYTGKY